MSSNDLNGQLFELLPLRLLAFYQDFYSRLDWFKPVDWR